MNRLNLSDSIDNSIFPRINQKITYSNYKYKIIFNGNKKIVLQENQIPVLCIEHSDNKVTVTGIVANVLKNKGLSEKNIVKEAWEMIYQISLLCSVENND